MPRRGTRSRFETAVQLGLLAIVFILLLLDVSANYVIFKTRLVEREEVAARFSRAGLAVSRRIADRIPSGLSLEVATNLRTEFRLADVEFLSGAPASSNAEAVASWLKERADKTSDIARAEVLRLLANEELQSLVGGEGKQYHALYPVATESRVGLLLISSQEPVLAYLDDVGQSVMLAGLLAGMIILVMYFSLSRYIFRPFAAIKAEARHAGRLVGRENNEVEAIIGDYRRIIGELQEKETELLRLNREIQRRADSLEQFNHYLLNSMSSGIVTIDRVSLLVSINQAAEKVLGISASGFLGRHYWDLFSSNIDLVNALSRALECAENRPYTEIDYQAGDGQVLHLGIIVSVIVDNNSRTVGASVLISDLTELVNLRHELEERKRLASLGEMAGGLAHQLRNSLGAIVGYGRLIEKRLLKAGLKTSSIKALATETQEAEALIERFLYFSRPLNFQPQETNLRELIQDLLESFRVRPDCQHIEFVYDSMISDQIPADALLLKQALVNLVENAVNSYNGQAGVVTVETQMRADQVEITIWDSGCGIAEGSRDKVFTPFYSSRPAGTGLGLPLVAKIVELHQGHISLESQEIKGTVVRVMLPIIVNESVPSPV